MPWCEGCSKFWNPNSMPPDGSCPSCGDVIAEPPDTTVPWHFWLLALLVVVYLGWRLVQLFQWLVGSGLTVIAVVLGTALVGSVAWLGAWLWRREPEDDEGASVAGGGPG
ncbi:MAG: hypothetical protein HYX32_03115 [Actinobacteria bacterium]|nr:hypothetical protein [Actinomycetota bacterium]